MHKNKTRCNMYLDKESVETIKDFLEGTGLTLSSYLDLVVCEAADNINNYIDLVRDTNNNAPKIHREKKGKKYFNIFEAHKILGLAGPKDLNFSKSSGIAMTPSQIKKIKEGKWQLAINKHGKLRIIKNPSSINKIEKDGLNIHIMEDED